MICKSSLLRGGSAHSDLRRPERPAELQRERRRRHLRLQLAGGREVQRQEDDQVISRRLRELLNQETLHSVPITRS